MPLMKHVTLEVKSLVESKDPNGEFEAILSMATVDRDGEVIDARAFEPLPERIPIDVDHGMSVRTTVGSMVPFYDDAGVLKGKGSYASTALGQDVRTLVGEGHISKMSVAFMNASRTAVDGVDHVTKAELLNAAFVAIPSNREASVTSSKSVDVALRAEAARQAVLEGDTKALTAIVEQMTADTVSDDDTKVSTGTDADGEKETDKITPSPAHVSRLADLLTLN